jgi:glycosyltransferase involved in cell wall biosynthesis
MNVANGYWIPLLRLRGIPVLINVDGMEWERAKWGRLAKLVFRIGAKLSARFANRLVFDAEAIAQRWRTEFFKDGAVIAYGGDPISELPVEPGLTHRGYALVVARFVPENTIPQFITAAEQISQTHDVVFVGSSGYGGEMEAQVQALVDTNPRAHWFGHVSDDTRLHALWQHAGVYFHGHSVGGTNPALVQAMACGAPIVARDTVFTREVLADTGRFTGPAPADIAAACLAVLNNPTEADRLADAAKARAAEAYTWESVNAAYERELAHLAQS